MAFFATHSGSPQKKTRCAATTFFLVNFPKIVNWLPALLRGAVPAHARAPSEGCCFT